MSLEIETANTKLASLNDSNFTAGENWRNEKHFRMYCWSVVVSNASCVNTLLSSPIASVF